MTEEEQRRADWEAQNAIKWTKPTPHKVVIEFERESDKDAFTAWMSDGGGEYQLMELLRENMNRRVDFLYHPPKGEVPEDPKTDRIKVIAVRNKR